MVTLSTLVSAPLTGASEANGLNNAGVVVGQLDGDVPFVWRPTAPNGTTGTATNLPVLPTGADPGTGTAMAINAGGVIAGFSDTFDSNGRVTRAVRWAAGGAIQDLGTLIPDPFNPGAFLGDSRAADINDNGQIVGRSITVLGVTQAMVFDPSLGFMRDLGALVLTSPVTSRATSINNNGDIVGVSDTVDANGNAVERAFLLPAGAAFMIDLGTLIPDPANPGSFLGNSSAFGINDNGMIIGTSDVNGVGPGGIQLTAATQFFNGSPPVSLLPVHSDGYDVGPNDRVVGNFDLPGKGFVFHSSTGMVDLTTFAATPGTTIAIGTGVNASGQITAVADVPGASIAVLITP